MAHGEDLPLYFKRVIDFPGIVRVPEQAKLDVLLESGGRVLEERQTEFQRILLIETARGNLMLLLDGQLQFYSGDEHRYHEALAVVPFLFAATPVRRVGIMGGGDGLIAREVLRHFGHEVERVRVVDVDRGVTDLAREQPALAALNEGSLADPRVEVVNEDAREHRSPEPYDLIICDLPDPTDAPLLRLYTREFYRHLRGQLAPGAGPMSLQIPYAPPVFDGVLLTLRGVFPEVREYALRMYSFVHVGFGLASDDPLDRRRKVPDGTRFLTERSLECMFYFPPDEPRAEVTAPSTDADPRIGDWYASYLGDRLEERVLYY